MLYTIFHSQLKDLKKMLITWRKVTGKEYPAFFDMFPHPDKISIEKLANAGIMTDACNSAQKTTGDINKEIIGKTHTFHCHNHLRNIWVKNILESLTEFMRAHLSDSLDEIVPALRVLPGFISVAHVFDNMFSLCSNYPKGWRELFCSRMKENHAGELVFHVE